MYPVYFFYTVRLRNYQVRQSAERFCKCKRLKELLELLEIEKQAADRLADLPDYKTFYVPKEEDGLRLIEAPAQKLKQVQSLLNFYLQCTYHLIRPSASYGFTMTTKDDVSPRTIYTNALQHQQAEWVFNLDLQDFFHSIPSARIEALFEEKPFRFTRKAAEMLTRLCTYQGRLPMGAPSSPILSNFVALGLDHRLSELARQQQWRYTRYADDITLSSQKPFTDAHAEAVMAEVQAEQFQPHQDKIRRFHKSAPPVVTGLLLRPGGPDVSDELIEEIKRGIRFLMLISQEARYASHPAMRAPVQSIRRSVQGQINFVAYIRGRQDKVYLKLQRKLDSLLPPPAPSA